MWVCLFSIISKTLLPQTAQTISTSIEIQKWLSGKCKYAELITSPFQNSSVWSPVVLKPSHDAYHQHQHPANSHFAHCRVWSNKINMKFGLIMQRRRLPLATSRFSHLHSLKEVLAHCRIWWHFLSIMLIKWKLVFERIIYVGRTSGFSFQHSECTLESGCQKEGQSCRS